MPGLNFLSFPILKTNRLLLRKLRKSDFKAIRILRSDESVNKYLNRIPAASNEDAIEFIKKIQKGILNGEYLYWAIILKDSNSLIGAIGLWNFSEKEMEAEIGFELIPMYQNKGLMTEALTVVVEYGLNIIKLRKINAFTHKENLSSKRLLLKSNFQLNKADTNVDFNVEEELDHYYLSKDNLIAQP